MKNTGYLTIIEVVRLILPFVALPYIIRVIGVERYGVVAFSQTIVSYFIIFINFGLDISAVKDVSIHRDNKDYLNKVISSVLLIKFMLFCISSCLFVLLILLVPYLRINYLLFSFTFIICISEILFPIWFFQGIEKMKYLTIIRTSSILFYAVTVFIFIKNSDDYIYVPLLQSLGSLFSGLIAFYLLFKVGKIKLLIPEYRMVRQSFLESIPFFISRVSVILNSSMAKVISGMFFSMAAVAIFDLVQKISMVMIIPAQMLNQAVYPHLAKKRDRVFANKFFFINILIACVLSGLLYVLAPWGISYFTGKDMPQAVTILRILSLLVFCGTITTYIGGPVLVSFGHPKIFNFSVVLSTLVLALFYLCLYIFNQFTIENFAIALFASEFVILLYRLYYCYRYKIFSL